MIGAGLLSAELVQRLAFCLVHSVWQASIVALLAGGIERRISTRSPEVRYAVFVAAMATVPALGVATFLIYDRVGPLVDATPILAAQYAQWTQWAVTLWMSGVALCSIRLSASWLLSRRLLRLADAVAPREISQMFDRIKQRMNIAQPIRLALSTLVEVPVVVGWLKPAILLPMSAITGLDADQLKAVLAHELAHIRRHDFAINLLQRCVESMFFYHPAVWWLSSRTRAEREHCCDDLAVKICGDRLIYVNALVALEETRGATSVVALAATGGSLSRRIRRLLGRDSNTPERLSVAVAGLFVGVWLLVSVWQSHPLMATPVLPILPLKTPAIAIAPPPMPIVELALMAMSGPAEQQVQAPAVLGVVVKAGTGEPLPGTRVGLVTTDGKATSHITTSAANGVFTLQSVAPGTYRLVADRSDGYLSAEYGQKSPGSAGAPIVVAGGQIVKDIQLALLPPGSIAGKVLDVDGQPVGHARVQALRYSYSSNGRTLGLVQSVSTNDLGEYRLFWLAPGSYFVRAAREPASVNRLQVFIQPPDFQGSRREDHYPLIVRTTQPNGEVVEMVEDPTFAPNVSDVRGATSFPVRSGDNIRGVDVRLSTPRPARTITGRVINSVAGEPLQGTVNARPVERVLSTSATTYSGRMDENGNFEITGLSPGSYTLLVNARPVGATPGGDLRQALLVIDVTSRDQRDVSIPIAAPISANGRFTVEGDPKVDLTTLRFGIYYAASGTGVMPPPVQPDGAFQFAKVTPGDQDITINQNRGRNTTTDGRNLAPGLYVKSVRHGATDVLKDGLHLDAMNYQTPIEVVLSANGGTVTGTVRNGRREALGNCIVALIPATKERFRSEFFRVAATDANGRFSFIDMRPGDYRLFAWEEIERGKWFDDEFLTSQQDRGRLIHIEEKSREDYELTVIP